MLEKFGRKQFLGGDQGGRAAVVEDEFQFMPGEQWRSGDGNDACLDGAEKGDGEFGDVREA